MELGRSRSGELLELLLLHVFAPGVAARWAHPSCGEQGGLTVLTSRERVDEVVTREASAWNHGYVVRALSTNADRRTVVEAPTLSQDELLALVTSERWFGR